MIQRIKGTMDILPSETPLFRYIEGIMREEAEKYGYGEIRTPTFENTELFVRGVGDTTDVVQKEMYTFADREENRSISLRPEGTASVARAIIENGKCSDPMPLKYYYIISCFRHEKPQRILFKPFAAGVAKASLLFGIVIHKRCSEIRSALLAADGIEVKLNVFKPEPFENRGGKRNCGCIRGRALRAEHLSAELEELAASACLRLFVPEAGDYIIILKRHRVGAFTVFNNSSCNRGCSLGAKRNRAVFLSVAEGIHFLLNNVRRVTDASDEKLGVFKRGRADFSVSVFFSLLTHNPLYISEKGRFVWKNIHCAFNFLYHFLCPLYVIYQARA